MANKEVVIGENDKKIQFGLGTTLVIAAMVIVAVIIYRNFIMDQFYSSYKEIMTVAREDDGTTTYIPYGEDMLLKYGRDGITAIDAKGKKVWSASYDMKNPKAVVCDKSVAVADIENKQLVIFDEKGNAQNVEVVLPISQVYVSKQGIAAVVLEDDMAHYIKLCDEDTQYCEIKTRNKEDGYPISVAYSPDGKKLVTSYIHVTGEVTENMVTFYNMSDVGQNYENEIVMALDMGESMVPKVDFIDDENVIILSDNKFYIYNMKEIPYLVYESKEYSQNIKSVSYDDEYVSVVTEDASTGKKTLTVFSVKGKKTGEASVDIEYDKMITSGKDTIFYSEKEIVIYTEKGNKKYNSIIEGNDFSAIQYNEKNMYYFIDEHNIKLIKLQKGE